jgi:GT2 family glycosyltransferase/glycosyltransferase involved in cell wall biosynthesis
MSGSVSLETLVRDVEELKATVAALSQQLAHTAAQGRRAPARRTVGELLWDAAVRIAGNLPLGGRLRDTATHWFLAGYIRVFPGSTRYTEHLRFLGARRKPLRPYDTNGLLVPMPKGGPAPADVLVFPVIDWHFRHQRPQQLAEQLAARGHRVFYFTTTLVPLEGFAPRAEPLGERIYQVSLPCTGRLPILYEDRLNAAQVDALLSGLEQVRERFQITATVSILHHPFWTPAVFRLPNNRTVYDCLDHHAGFSNTASGMLDLERQLIAEADLVVATAQRLYDRIAPLAQRTALVRNGTAPEHFARAERQSASTRPVIGYYGAIADWFDSSLVAHAARELGDCDFVLIGSTYSADLAPLEGLPNVHLLGEIPYAELPPHAQRFDVCMIPFKVNELTLHTNPVKVYEYLSMGKPVVSVRLPELELLGDVVTLTSTPEEFAAALRASLGPSADETVAARRAVADANTWATRAEQFDAAVAPLFPLVSVIVLTHNSLAFTKACLDSLERFTDYPNWELVVVDNASTDGTRDFLRAYVGEEGRAHVRLVLNDTNVGFAAGNNAGAREARGSYLVFLNNDTFVTRGWIGDLLRHFDRNPQLGLLNPITNNIGNEARVEIAYADMGEMADRAARLTRARRGQTLDMAVCAFFCVMIPRTVWTKVGELDERFELGFFEDDDYARRAASHGYALACAEDVFVHHHLSASFDALGAERKRQLFEVNRRRFEEKWGPWEPHRYRR